MDKSSDVLLLVKIAKMYYEEGKTQASIAEELGLTRLRVIGFLKRAKSEGIVRIKIVDPLSDFMELEESVSKKYGLKKVVVTLSSDDDAGVTLSHIGRAASLYLYDVVGFNDVLGIGWGMTILETSKYLKRNGGRSITAVPLIGGGNETHIQYDVNGLTKKFADSFGGESFSLFAPAIVDSKIIRDTIISDSRINQIYDFWNKLNVVLIGIGMMTKEFPSVFHNNYIAQPINFRGLGIAGDILTRFYNADGKNIELEMHERMIGIDLDTIKKADTVIGVAGGLEKYSAILGAIKGGIINVLITDENVAIKLANI
ncbi:MAG: sugar-binding transcriptional regulator [Oscillospiraceae bacterium]|nr:sugar-binding transcriptional regulator [Oscillospiraceae bacterium]